MLQKIRLWVFALGVGCILLAAGWGLPQARAGGWAVVTLESLPAEVVAARPFTVRFSVRQHGQHLMSDLSPTVTAVHSQTQARVTATAVESSTGGTYEAAITLPAAGQWRWSIEAFTATYTMPPLTATAVIGQSATLPAGLLPGWVGFFMLLAAGGLAWAGRQKRRRLWLAGAGVALLVALLAFSGQWQQPQVLVAEEEAGAAVDPEQMGEALFVAKGCIQCHQNGKVTMAQNLISIGPNLTHYKTSPEFLRRWLADPASVRPETLMPNLNLDEAEIEALSTFLLSP